MASSRLFFAGAAITLGRAGIATLLFGAVQAAAGVLCILAENFRGAVTFAVSGVLLLVLGTWIRTAGASLRSVALRADGHAALVMSAVADIRRIFRFHAVLFSLGAAIGVLGMVAVLLKQ